jgi:hypothetical protein
VYVVIGVAFRKKLGVIFLAGAASKYMLKTDMHPVVNFFWYKTCFPYMAGEIYALLGVGLYFVRITHLRFDEKHATPDLTNSVARQNQNSGLCTDCARRVLRPNFRRDF